MTTKTHPKIRKPRDADGAPLTPEKIKALRGVKLRDQIAVSLFGYVGKSAFWGAAGCPAYDSNLRAAWEIDRPDWLWSFREYAFVKDESFAGVEYSVELSSSGFGIIYFHATDGKPTPADHATARCIAALLLATEIGE